MKEKTLSVSAIQEGTVIDHIASGAALKIIRLLKLEKYGLPITPGLYLKSRSMGLKDLIKIERFFLAPDQAAQIAAFAPEATVNVIENYSIAKKFKVQIPKEIRLPLLCPNRSCVTNEEGVQTVFTIDENDPKHPFQCRFCEKLFFREEMSEINA